MNIDGLKKLNHLAKTLKATGIAHSMDDAVKMAEKMMQEDGKTITELAVEGGELIPEAVHDRGFVDKVRQKVREITGDSGEDAHIKKELPEEEQIGEEPEEEREAFIIKKPVEEKQEEQEQILETKKEGTDNEN